MSAESRSLRAWVSLSTAGGVLLSGWFVFILWVAKFAPPVIFHVDLRRHHLLGGVFLLWVAGLAMGGWLAFWPQRRIRDGIRHELWAESEIAPIRRMVNRICLITSATFFLSGICLWVKWLHNSHPSLVIYCPCFIAMQWGIQLSKSIGPPPQQSMSNQILSPRMAPIQSEHWGER